MALFLVREHRTEIFDGYVEAGCSDEARSLFESVPHSEKHRSFSTTHHEVGRWDGKQRAIDYLPVHAAPEPED